MIRTRNKVLRKINPTAIKRVAAEGGALTLKELAVVTNYSYDAVRIMAKEKSFPRLLGKVTLEDFKAWKQKQFAQKSVLVTRKSDPNQVRPQHDD